MKDTLDNRMRFNQMGMKFPCANCGREVPSKKALDGADHVFCTRTCWTKFLNRQEVYSLTAGQKERLFTWYRDYVIDAWTEHSGSNYFFSNRQKKNAFKRRTRGNGDNDALPAGAPLDWLDFLYGAYMIGELAPEGHIFKHPFFVSLNTVFNPQINPVEEPAARNGRAGKNGIPFERALADG